CPPCRPVCAGNEPARIERGHHHSDHRDSSDDLVAAATTQHAGANNDLVASARNELSPQFARDSLTVMPHNNGAGGNYCTGTLEERAQRLSFAEGVKNRYATVAHKGVRQDDDGGLVAHFHR